MLLHFFSVAKSQESYTLHIHTDKKANLGDLLKSQTGKDSAAVVQQLRHVLSALRFKGYLLAETDTLVWSGYNVSATIKLNQQFLVVSLKNGNIEQRLLSSAGYAEKLFHNRPFNQQELELLFQNLLQVYENQGYPFASVGLDSIQIRDSLISARLVANPGNYIAMRAIQTVGNVALSKTFLQSYLGINEHKPYNESVIRMADENLRKLPFLEVVKPAVVNFTGNNATLNLFLNKKNANRFDGILGLSPSTDGKMHLTGDMVLQLNNAFRRAEHMSIHFKGFAQQSRELDLQFSVPFIFASPIGIGADFNLYKQDTSFQNISFRAEASYPVSAIKRFGFYIENKSGNIFTDTLTSLTYASHRTTLYGLTYQYKKLDDQFSPLKGMILKIDGSAGFKHAKRLVSAEADSSWNKSAQYRLETLFDWYIPLGRQSVFRLENQSAVLGGRRLYENELYRLGGFNSLLGFDEKSILASSYSVFTIEYRYLIERYSFLFLFCNQALIAQKTIIDNKTDTPLGFGAGINLETKAGIFSLSYALGKQRNIPVNLRQGKIHFGLIALF